MRWLASRSLGLALVLVLAGVAAAPASAATSTQYLGGFCWQINYPPDPCHFEPGIGVGADVSGYEHHTLMDGGLGSVPANALVSKATLRLYQSELRGAAPGSELGVGAIKVPYAGGNYYDPDGAIDGESVVNGPTPAGVGNWTEIDITSIVHGWQSGRFPQHGLKVFAVTGGDVVVFSSAQLVIEYDVACPSNPYAAASVTSEAIVHDWNQQLLARFRDVTDPSTPAIRRSPTWTSRAAAMLNVGLFDTFNSVYFAKLESLATGTPTNQVCGWESYLTLADTPANTNANLAAGYAARAILIALYPDKSAQINSAFSTIHGGPSYDATAFALGNHVATRIINARASDGSGAAMSYTPASGTPGAWRPSVMGSGSATCAGAVTPQWGNVTPFTMYTGAQFRPPLPGGHTTYSALLASTLYADNVIEVKDKGRYPQNLSTRTNDEEEAAWFWANDVDGTYKPPGQLLQHTKELILTQPAAQSSGDPVEFFRTWSREGIRVARLYAEISLAMADSGIAAWDAKYNTPIDLWRPIEAVRLGDTDGNASTPDIDTWEPLSRTIAGVQFSPCFPAWVSGHATFGGTWSRVMENEFAFADDHDDPFPLTLSTEDPHSVANSDLTRTFNSFDEAGEENAESRIWLGVHYRIDAEGGLTTGRKVANNVTQTRLRPIKACPGWGCATAIP